jgi:hypothetical protein
MMIQEQKDRFRKNMNAFKLVICFLMALLPLLAAGVAVGNDIDTLTDKALRVSGITGQLDDLSAAIVSAVPADAFPSAKMRSEANSFVKKNAGKNALVEMVHSTVRRAVDKESLEKVIAFYESKLGKKIGRLQGAALEPSLLKSIREGRNVMAAADESRLHTLKRIVTSDRAADTNALMLNTVLRGLLEGYSGDTPETANDEEVVRGKMKIMDKSVRALEDRTEELALAAYAYTYRSLDDQELKDLATFRESSEATRFGEAVRKGLEEAVYKTARVFAEAVLKWRSNPAAADSSAGGQKSTMPTQPAVR